MSRYAAIDIGTNSVLLLVAERDVAGRWHAVEERAEITRL
ncbi:MAG: Ppx/GppA family phosphatase, partial [Myxococcaceae bacterium]|nr:Ppx/GppA family phosphatase [Myxococcaceae bacterium]